MQIQTVEPDLWIQLPSINLNKQDLILNKQQHPSYWSFYANYIYVYLLCLSIKFHLMKYVLLVPKIKRLLLMFIFINGSARIFHICKVSVGEKSCYSRLLNIDGLFRAVKNICVCQVETLLYLGLTVWRGLGMPNSFSRMRKWNFVSVFTPTWPRIHKKFNYHVWSS